MAHPSTSLATLRPDLGASIEEFDLAMDRAGFIGHRVLPVHEVGAQAGPYGIIPVEQLLRSPDTSRSPGSGYKRGTFKFETGSYATIEQGWEEPVDDREGHMYANYFDQEQVAAQRAQDIVLRAAEARIAAAIFNATTWSAATTAITHEWDDATNAVPVNDVKTAGKAVWTASGLWPDTLIIGKNVFDNLRRSDQIMAEIRSVGAGDPTKQTDVTVDMLSSVFDLPKILVGRSGKNTGKEGAALTMAPIWSDEYAMVCRTSDSPDFREPCVGRTFHWAEDGSDVNGTVETYREESIRGDVLRVRHDVAEKILYVAAGHLLSNATT